MEAVSIWFDSVKTDTQKKTWRAGSCDDLACMSLCQKKSDQFFGDLGFNFYSTIIINNPKIDYDT